MITSMTASNPKLLDVIFSEASRDVSAHSAWYIKYSELDLFYSLVGVFSATDLAKNAFQLRKDNLEVAPLPEPLSVFAPRTELARHLWEIRLRVIASGESLLDWEGVRNEVAERRAEWG
jgi:hypothetical protein